MKTFLTLLSMAALTIFQTGCSTDASVTRNGTTHGVGASAGAGQGTRGAGVGVGANVGNSGAGVRAY